MKSSFNVDLCFTYFLLDVMWLDVKKIVLKTPWLVLTMDNYGANTLKEDLKGFYMVFVGFFANQMIGKLGNRKTKIMNKLMMKNNLNLFNNTTFHQVGFIVLKLSLHLVVF